MKRKLQNILWPVISVLIGIILIVFFQVREHREQEESFKIPEVDYWKQFAQISKERKYFAELDTYYRIPVFTSNLIAQEGKEISLTGFYLPYSELDSVIIVSRYPNASCFFCGQAGIESVVMVELGKPYQPNTYRVDQMLLVHGKLQLNATDVNKLAFIITDARIKALRL
ncbi:hypothetical protein [Ekhidna sp.]|uniref:hypothetical protein n=1 Tax=Ekhidna sp. TaxID=2608089 RepID=UPI003C7A5837